MLLLRAASFAVAGESVTEFPVKPFRSLNRVNAYPDGNKCDGSKTFSISGRLTYCTTVTRHPCRDAFVRKLLTTCYTRRLCVLLLRIMDCFRLYLFDELECIIVY